MPESIKQRMGEVPDRHTDTEIRSLLTAVLADLTSLRTQFNQLLTDYNAHVHGGVTAGAANTSDVANSTATAVTLTLAA